MDAASLYQVQASIAESISGLWELWLGGTFAMIVAFHIGRRSITWPLLITGCALYVLACSSIAMRYVAFSLMIGDFNQQLVDAGAQTFPLPQWFIAWNSRITVLTFFLGTLSTLIFAIWQFRHRDDSGI